MDAKKCDRCGKFYEIGKNEGEILLKTYDTLNNYENNIDLCDSCLSDFLKFMKCKGDK